MRKMERLAALAAPEDSGRLVRWQFSVDNDWLGARGLALPATEPERAALARWVGDAAPNIAVEALFETAAGEHFFFGVRLVCCPKPRQAEIAAALAALPAGLEAGEAVSRIAAILGLPDLARTEPDLIELGVFNWWMEVGPHTLYRRGDAAAVTLGDLARDAPQLLRTHPMPIMLEVGWGDRALPYQHWLGVPVSAPVHEANRVTGYALKPERYTRTLAVALAFFERARVAR